MRHHRRPSGLYLGKTVPGGGPISPERTVPGTLLQRSPRTRKRDISRYSPLGELARFRLYRKKTNVRERLGPERTVPGKTVPEFLTSGTVNLFQVQSARELYLGLQFSLKPEVEVRPGEVQSAHAPMIAPACIEAGGAGETTT